LDGVEKLENFNEMRWLPNKFPENIRVIITTKPGQAEFAAKVLSSSSCFFFFF